METTLFYSKYCNHCKDFLIELKKLNILNYFENYICIDKRKEIPEFVKIVPCILVKDYDEPLSGDKAFKWIDFMKLKKSEYEEKKSNINAFDFNNNFDNYDDINENVDKKSSITKSNSLQLDMLEQPLLSPNEINELTKKYENASSFDERLAQLEKSRN